MPDGLVMRGFLANIEVLPPLIVTFQFNPETLSDNKEVHFRDVQGQLCGTAPDKEYTGGGDRTISFKLNLHGLEEGTNRANPTGLDNGIATELAKLRSFLYPAADAWGALNLFGGGGGRQLQAPPTVVFGFGTRLLECVVTNLTITETQFNSFLAPVRADVDITLKVIEREGSPLFELDKQHRNVLAALGLANISPV